LSLRGVSAPTPVTQSGYTSMILLLDKEGNVLMEVPLTPNSPTLHVGDTFQLAEVQIFIT
jgi:hypothetical protein